MVISAQANVVQCHRLLHKYVVFSGAAATRLAKPLVSFDSHRKDMSENQTVSVLVQRVLLKMALSAAKKKELKRLRELTERNAVRSEAMAKQLFTDWDSSQKEVQRIKKELDRLSGTPVTTRAHDQVKPYATALDAELVAEFFPTQGNNPYLVALNAKNAIIKYNTSKQYEIYLIGNGPDSALGKLYAASKLYGLGMEDAGVYRFGSKIILERPHDALEELNVGEEYPVSLSLQRTVESNSERFMLKIVIDTQ